MKTRADWPSSLTDAELNELDRYLRACATGDTLLLDGVHGLLSALVVGPGPILPEEWLPEVLHEPFVNPEEGHRVLMLLAKLNDSIRAELEMDAYEPVLGELDTEPMTGLSAAGWCEGFTRGIDLRAGLWEKRLTDDPALMDLLGPVMALSVDEGVLNADPGFERLDDDEYDQCVSQLSAVLTAIYQYWKEHPVSEEERHILASPTRIDAAGVSPRQRHGHWLH